MNVGVNNSSAIGALIVSEGGLGDEGALFTSYSSFDDIRPFQAVNVTASWRPESKGIRTAIWATAASLESVIGLISNIDTLILGVLDDFLVRDVFVIEPISSTSVFPNVLPFAPFDIRFPADFGMYTFILSTTESLGNMTITNHGNASDWGNMSLTQADTIEGFYEYQGEMIQQD